MSLYTERHGMRDPLKKTYDIDVDAYALLFDCCERYFKAIAWKYPSDEVDAQGCGKVDTEKLIHALKVEIPNLYGVDSYSALGWISLPSLGMFDDEIPDYDQYALIDFIELVYRDCRDITYPYESLCSGFKTNVKRSFKQEINDCFKKTGLQYKMVAHGVIERIVDESVLSKETLENIKKVPEKGIRDLLKDAILEFRKPSPKARQHATELIWDALERLKTYYTSMDKKSSAAKIVNDMAGGQAEYIAVFDEEFKALTKIGNNFRIRHHETDKIDITDARHYDYFFNRCLSLIALAIQYLE